MPRQFGVPEDIIKRVTSGFDGPETYSPFLSPIHSKHIIAINNAYMIGSWIDVVFFGDCNWYTDHRFKLAEFRGIKVTSCGRFAHKEHWQQEGVKYLDRDHEKGYGISSDPTKVAWNQNSGAAAISLAHHFGVKRIILLGFDMKLDPNRKSHWHGMHGYNKKGWAPPFPRHLKGFEYIDRDAKELGLEIINASPESAIEQFPKVEVKDLLNNQEEQNESCSFIPDGTI